LIESSKKQLIFRIKVKISIRLLSSEGINNKLTQQKGEEEDEGEE